MIKRLGRARFDSLMIQANTTGKRDDVMADIACKQVLADLTKEKRAMVPTRLFVGDIARGRAAPDRSGFPSRGPALCGSASAACVVVFGEQ